ncbi:MAG: hypothetical protein OXF25_11055 [Cyanobacteria bacterium MAG CAR3_bin_5]|nr:hypothetical protein [Cyanobacteria bacterium MAG CAR3_bin_5]
MEFDPQFILSLLTNLDNRRNNSGRIDSGAHAIWPEPSQKILDYLNFMLKKNLIAGAPIKGPGGQDVIFIDEITWRGEELLNQSSG